MRDSGLDISYALRAEASPKKELLYNAIMAQSNNSTALICNQPDNSTAVVTPRKRGPLSYSHGFNIVEEGMQIRKDITVIMCAPKVLDLKYEE
jgi:ketol-acid reductoisomerase